MKFHFSTLLLIGLAAIAFQSQGVRSEDAAPAAATEEVPAEEPAEAPAPEPTEAPAPEPTEAPAPEPTEAPAPEPTEAPAPEPTEAPAPEPTEAPAPEATEAPAPEATEAPAPEATEAPADTEPLEESTAEKEPITTARPSFSNSSALEVLSSESTEDPLLADSSEMPGNETSSAVSSSFFPLATGMVVLWAL